MTRPAHLVGRPPMFTPEQVRAWREEWQRRTEVLSQTRSLTELCREAGVNTTAMRNLLSGETYKWVRND